MQISFDIGSIVSINPQSKDKFGRPSPSGSVKSSSSGATLEIPTRDPSWAQIQPSLGSLVLFMSFRKYEHRVIKYWSNFEDFLRHGESALNSGEIVIQSPSGLGYLKLDQDGRVQVVTGDTGSVLDMGIDGTSVQSPNIKFFTIKGTSIEIFEDNSLKISQVDTTDEELPEKASLFFSPENEISVTSTKSISIKAPEIHIDGEKIFIGKGATEKESRELFGKAVSSGENGTYPFNSSGVEVPGSSSVRLGGLNNA